MSETKRATITRGFNRVDAFVSEDGNVRVEKAKRRHKFGEGYQTVGPRRTIYEGHLMDAALVADVLRKIFDSECEIDAETAQEGDS